jgi:hypothetical protein
MWCFPRSPAVATENSVCVVCIKEIFASSPCEQITYPDGSQQYACLDCVEQKRSPEYANSYRRTADS